MAKSSIRPTLERVEKIKSLSIALMRVCCWQ